ncbi:cobyric acid synthase [Companilactobacillus ginsenosidimutans]|uniref:Cobyric acid synthase n=1 Tax=Companilactobacillus ginsenosidimutans TaxID=1007676 RepID=A0A0H4QE61_9LACO|nr:cobyric acid synthase [Companilactobacillus ginsenosidimutans]AKP66222.1 cobalamin biosynthesis protein CobQ [Companilactobacillus ginsenosidimutans]
MTAKSIMFQGTASDSGKSWMVAALCRYLAQRGDKVVPFKSQNMALNSYITADGQEMGRAQVFQAEASGILPDVRMNPILLKPSTDSDSQVVVNGKVLGDMSAAQYQEFKPQLRGEVTDTYNSLANEYDDVILEGAGSPAEINLNKRDFVNMGMADIADAPVILVADIDKGGVFASIYGTIKLLPKKHQNRIKGIIINKFRGDVSLLQNGNDMIEDLTGVPVLGVMPYSSVQIDDEDSVALTRKNKVMDVSKDLDIVVVVLPKISNFTDFNSLAMHPDVSVRYATNANELGTPDLVIIPGSKNTNEDLAFLKETKFDTAIQALHSRGTFIFGVCGGYQILGKKLIDANEVESDIEEQAGLGLLNTTTYYEDTKTTTQSKATIGDLKLDGYEIHMGRTVLDEGTQPLAHIYQTNGNETDHMDGAVNDDKTVYGTYLHGIFDNPEWTRGYLNQIRESKGLGPLKNIVGSLKDFKETQYDELAKIFTENVDVDRILEIMDASEKVE